MSRGREAHRLVAAGLLCVLAVLAFRAPPAGADVTITGVGQVALPADGTGAGELSGIAHAGGSQYYVVSDANATVYPLTITLDATTGAVTATSMSAGTLMAGGSDLEGIAFAGGGAVWLCDETGPAIRKHSLTTGAQIDALTLPAVFANIRSNLSLEGLSRQADGSAIWTANEEALSVDGPVSTSAAGTVVRLQKFDSIGAPAGQFAYLTDSIAGAIPDLAQERSGVSDLLVLPNGTLLVLEREVDAAGLSLVWRNRIYEVDLAGATDTSAIAALDGAAYTLVGKTLRWEGVFANDNFEGMTLGPQLDDGSFALLLVSDDGSVSPFFPDQSLYALKVAGDVPEPAAVGLLALGAAGMLRRRRRGARAGPGV